jgi:hypothetical protein
MNFVIWKVDTAGIIHLYAGSPGTWGCGGYDQVLVGNGGPATNATVEGGGPLAVDAVGGLIIGDSEPGVASIRRIDPQTQVITSLVGNPGWNGTQGNGWMSNTRYFPGAIIQASVPETIAGYPTVNTNVVFTTTTGGLSGPTAPNFSPTLVYNKNGSIAPSDVNTITDGSVVWSFEKIGTFGGVGCASQVDKYGDGCTGVNAALLNIDGIALDSQGNLYFSDWQPNGTIYTGNGNTTTDNTATVRRMDAQTGIVTVYAGNVSNASYGHAGDGKSATDPSVLISPTNLAFDSKGNLYILEGGYVRMVSTAAPHTITTVVGNGKPYTDSGTRGFNCAVVGDGGLATSAELNAIDIAFDAADNMYLLGSGNCALRRVDAATQIITTIAGDSLDLQNSQNYTSFPYPFYNPYAGLGYLATKALHLDGNANIYVATGGEGVQKIDTSHSFMDFTWDTVPNNYPVGSSTGPLTSTVVNAGNSGPLTFSSPFTNPLAFGISSGDFTRDSSASDCIANASTGLMPGTECPIHIDFTPTTAGSPLIETDTLNDNGTIATQSIALYGNSVVSPTVTLLPHLLSFASTVGVWPATQYLTLTNNTSSDVPITGVSLTGPGVSAFQMANGCGSPLAANGGNCQIAITFLSPALGQYLAQVVVTDTIAGVASKQLSSLVGLTGTANASFRPDAHDFGQINIDLTSNPVEFELVSSGSVPVIVTSVKLTGNNPDQFQITTNGCTPGLSIAPGSHCSVWVEFAPTQDSPANSNFTAQLEAIDNAGNSPEYASLSGMGVGSTPIPLNISETIHVSSTPPSFIKGKLLAISETIHVSAVNGGGTAGKTSNTITFTAPASPVTYGAPAVTLSASASSGLTVSFGATGACSVSGSTLTFTGAGSCAVTANQAGNASYAPATPVTDSITVNPAALTVTAANASRAYGVANPAFTDTIAGYVSGDTSSAVSGAASLTTTATTTSVAGTYPISAAQGTLAASNYSFAFVSGTLTVNQATPTVTWAMPAAISYGTALSGAQLDASSAVAGTFAYTPALGTVLKAGSGQTLSVTFTPTDTTDYATPAAATTTLTVNQATPTITWATPAAITYGTALSGAQLNASSAVAGTFVYTPVTGTVLATGTQTLSVIFTPTDATDYTPAVLTVQLNVTNITVSGTAVSVAPGATTGNTSTITVTPVSGFTGTVSLSCAISPTAASDPATCSLSPASVAISGAAQTSTLTVSTTAATTCSAMNHPKLPREPWYAVGGATLACLLLFGIPAQRRSWRTLLGMLALLVALSGGVLACGGGTGGGGGNNCTPNSGTTAGSYTITVTGTSGTITATNTITLTVQ